jgi:hypothetical protein
MMAVHALHQCGWANRVVLAENLHGIVAGGPAIGKSDEAHTYWGVTTNRISVYYGRVHPVAPLLGEHIWMA